MSKIERATDPSNHENGSTHPTLEQLFTTQNPAAIVMFDLSNGYGIDRRRSLWDLVSTYKPIFGKKGEVEVSRDGGNEGFLWLTQERRDYGETDDSRRMRWIKENEAETMAKLLFMPSADPEQIRQRQQLLEYLSSSENLDNLIALKNQTYNLIAGIQEIGVYWSIAPFSEASLIDLYYDGRKKLPIFEDEYSDEVIDEEEILPLISTAVDMINTGIGSIKDLSTTIATQQDSPLQQALSDIPSFMAGIEKELAYAIPFDKAETPEPKHYEVSGHLWDLLREKVEPYLFRVGATLELARRVRDEGWGKVSSDSNKPYGYAGGWNLERSKSKQVHNDSPIEVPVVLLSGANTSGKSFTMKSDFLIRIAAQSLGYAPVNEANLPLCKSFVYLDRTSGDPENNLSAFMREVENWKIALSSVGSNSRLYVDEGYSTTSPQDQARLLLATAAYIRKGGGSVMLATHNDVMLSLAEQNPNMAIYHLQTTVGDNGKLIRYFRLQPGINESLALAVAEARNFPRNTMGFVEDYLHQEVPLSKTLRGCTYPAVEHFSAEEREQRKRQPSTLESLFPNAPENPVFHLFSLDPDFRVEALLRHLMPSESVFPFTVFESGELGELLGQMILWNPELLPAEIFERQKMFSELLQGTNYQDIHKAIEKIAFLEETFTMVAKHTKDGINKGLNPFQKEEPRKTGQFYQQEEETPKIEFSYESLQAAIAFLGIQQKLLGDNFHFGNLLEDSIALANALNMTREEQTKEVVESGVLTEEQTATFEHLIVTLRDINGVLPSISFKDIRLGEIQEELTILETYQRGGESHSVEQKGEKKSGMMWLLGEMLDLAGGGLPYAIQKLPNDLESAESLVTQLKTSNSVYLYQAANLIQQQIDKYRAVLQGNANEEEIKEIPASVLPDRNTLSQFDHLGRRSFFSTYLSGMKGKDSIFRGTIKRLDALCLFANIIQDEDLAPVDFNDTGEVRLLNAFSIFKKKEEEVKNGVSLNAENERIELLTGPNGSGKTFYEKGVVGSVLMGLATGFAPAENASIPVFDAVAYLDRVVEKQDVRLSAFSQELEYWKELLPLLHTKKAVFTAVDEAFSSTSPFYQAAFTYAVIAEFLQSSHFLMLSTHNHDVVERLRNAQTGLIHPYHFQFSIENGKVVYHYTKHKGHETSHAVEVARTLGLPEAITSSLPE